MFYYLQVLTRLLLRQIFFYKAMLQNTKELPDVDLDFKWLTMQEMQKVIPNSYFRQIVRFAS